jgi:hypothetical protein
MRQRIKIQERLPIWGLRLILGVMLLTLSELVMWQNPQSHRPLDWLVLLVLYTALAAILMDITVRFQANGIASLLLVSGLYGLVSGAIVNHNAFVTLPYSLVIQGMAMQTGAGFYGLLLYVTVMRGRQIEPLHVAGAALLGAIWGIWVHWYPLRSEANVELVTIETATLYILPALVIVGLLIMGIAPQFRFFREEQLKLKWWEAIVAGVPLFVALVVGVYSALIPLEWLIVMVVIGVYMVWALTNDQHGYEPSILAEATFAAPNVVTYIVLAVAFLVAGTLSYSLVINRDSPAGVAVFLIILASGVAWLPGASMLIFLQFFRRRSVPASGNTSMGEDKDG